MLQYYPLYSFISQNTPAKGKQPSICLQLFSMDNRFSSMTILSTSLTKSWEEVKLGFLWWFCLARGKCNPLEFHTLQDLYFAAFNKAKGYPLWQVPVIHYFNRTCFSYSLEKKSQITMSDTLSESWVLFSHCLYVYYNHTISHHHMCLLCSTQ